MSRINSEEFSYKKPPLDDYLVTYNNLIASILSKNKFTMKYIASATLNRLESQTHLYEKLEKYVQIRQAMSADKNLVICLENDDQFFYNEIVSEFGRERVERAGSLRGQNQFLFKFIAQFVFTLCLSIYGSLYKNRKPRYEAVVRSYFDYRCKDSDGRMREEYFGPFMIDLVKNKKTLVIFKLIHRSDLIKYMALSKKADFDSSLIETMLTPLAVIKAFWSYLFSKIKITDQYTYKGIDLTPLLQKALNDDYKMLRGLGVYIEHEVVKVVMQYNPDYVFYPFENQCWEKMYPFVKHKNGHLKTCIVGFQHTGLSYKLLNYFPTIIDCRPELFPDKIFTVGRIFSRLLKEKAVYPCEVTEGAALRHQHLVSDGRYLCTQRTTKYHMSIAYAFSYDISKYKKIIEALIAVFGDTNISVYLKIHPIYVKKDIINELKLTLPKNILMAKKLTWDEIYNRIDFVLYDDNSVGIEAMINGVKSFLFDVGEPIYDCNRMYYFEGWETTLTKEQANEIKECYGKNHYDKMLSLDKTNDYINDYYTAYSNESNFKFLISHS